MVMALTLRAGLWAFLAAGLIASSGANANDGDSIDSEAPVELQETDDFGACWDNIEPALFVDTADLSEESKAAIDCMYHYGITRGTSAITYSPAAPVIRYHTALSLIRASRVLGLNIPEEAKAIFDDAEWMSAEGKLAIAQLKEMGITQGYSPQFFGPANNVERVHMAHFLFRILQLTGIDLPVPGDEDFGDVAVLSAAARRDISVMVELGIMDLVTTGRFDPSAAVTREDMALSLARILELAEVDPVSLEIGLSSESLLVGGAAIATIRARKPDGSPYSGLLIDVFADHGWHDTSACNLDTDARLNGGDAGTSEGCRIDVGDPRTDSNGEVTIGLAHTSESAVNWIIAWAGTLGQEFHKRKVRSEAKRKIDWQPTPNRVTTADPINIAFGRSVSIDARLVGPNSAGRRMVGRL